MTKTNFISSVYPILPLGNVSSIAYSDKETLFNFIASVIYLILIHFVMRVVVKRVPEYKKESKEMPVCHFLTAGVSAAMLFVFGMTDMLIKGTVFYLILLYASLCDNHTRNLNDVVSVMVLITAFIGTEISDIPSKAISALILFGILLLFAVITDGGLGGADVKLTGACAFVLGFWNTTLGLVLGLFIAIVHNLIKHKGEDKSELSFPFVPYLSIGFMAAFFLQGGI